MIDSGNSYKVRLLLAKLNLAYEHIATSSRDGSTRTQEFLTKNPIGKVPLLELADGRFVAESNAILLYLADGSSFIPVDRYDRAKLYEWLFFEQYSHEPNVAVRRALKTYPERAAQATSERLAQTLAGGVHALSVMEHRLEKAPFLVGDAPTIADISLYAYTHDAETGGFNLGDYPAVSAWLERIAAEPRHVPMRDPRLLAAPTVGVG